ncbi:hypothetical protein E2320_014234 [Naja naja]|nr:hypothetical protein E2320_014234 [Naja naja]
MAGDTHYLPDAYFYWEMLLSVHEVEPAEMLSVWEAAEHPCSAWQRFPWSDPLQDPGLAGCGGHPVTAFLPSHHLRTLGGKGLGPCLTCE